MNHLNSAPTREKPKGLRSLSLKSKLAVLGTTAALIAAPAVVGVTAANAVDAFAITTPANNATDVAQTFPNVVPFAGTGLPAGDYAYVTYLDATGATQRATFSGSEGTGSWTGDQNFADLSTGQTHVVATATARVDDGKGPDGQGTIDESVQPATVAFDLAVAPNPANPFTVTAPESNSATPVASTMPTFSGTGNPGATIKITYGARALQTGTAATVTVGEDGNWTTATDFSQLEPGSTDGSALVNEFNADGTPFPGADQKRINFTFPSAPAPAIPLTLTTDPMSSTVASATSTGVKFLATGFSPNEEVTIAVTDPNGGSVSLPTTTDHFYADSDTGSFAGQVILPSTAGTGTYTITVTGVRTNRVTSGTFVVTANPVKPVVPTPGGGSTTTGSLPVVAG